MVTSTFGRHRPRQSTAVDSKVDSGRQWTLVVAVNLWSTVVDSGRQWVDRRMVDRGSTVVDSAVDRVDRVDRVDSQGSNAALDAALDITSISVGTPPRET